MKKKDVSAEEDFSGEEPEEEVNSGDDWTPGNEV